MINSIIDILKTKSTIKNVFHRDDFVSSPRLPYIVVWEETVQNYDNKNGVAQYYISVHVDKGQIDILEKYITTELTDLLHNAYLTDGLTVIQLKSTLIMSNTIYSNDDGSVSKDRLFVSPMIGML
jgi:hypothetical protein